MDKTKSFFMHDEKNTGKKRKFGRLLLLRCITNRERDYHNPKMEEYCKSITSVLLFGDAEKLSKYEIKQVKTWLQWKSIDLCAEFYLFNNETQKEEKECISASYRAYTMDEVLNSAKKEKEWDWTGNTLFDEF